MSSPARRDPAAVTPEGAEETRIVETFLPRIRVFGRRHLRDADVEDFCQDVLIAVLDAVRRKRVEGPLGAYVLGICRNLAAGRWRRDATGQKVLGAVEREAPPDPPEDPAPRFFERWHLEDCLSRLTRRLRDVLYLSYFEERTADEVGVALDLEPGHVRVLRHRGLAQLRECLGSDPYGAPA